MSNYLGFEPTDSPEYWFVSYNNEDAERVSGLACAINNAGIPLWYDYGIEYGEKWAWQINEKIAGAQGMILLLTRGILQKENSYVQKEYRIATEADKKIVVLMVDEITKQDVPVRKLDWWVDIREKQCLEICRLDRQDKALDEIRRALNLPAGEKTGETPAPQPAEETQEKKTRKKKWLVPVLLLCAAALIVTAVWQIFFHAKETPDPYDIPDFLGYLEDFTFLGGDTMEEDEYNSRQAYYDYEGAVDADVSGLLAQFESGSRPFKLIYTKEYDQVSTRNTYYQRYYYQYTGRKEIEPALINKQEDTVESHMQILVGRHYDIGHTYVELITVPGLTYAGAEQTETGSPE